MEPIVGLDLSLAFLGFFAVALSAGLWLCRPPRRRSLGMIAISFLGVGSLAVAAIDVGLSEWDKARRPDGHSEGLVGIAWSDLPKGSIAPDFALPCLEDGRTIRLSDFRGRKPVVLVLSSFT